MTDHDPKSGEEPRDRDRPPADAKDGAHEPHGLVEEIAEEIQEVVEHVPAPVRWTVRRIVGLTVLIFFGLVAVIVASILLYFANRTEWVAKEVALLLNQTLAARSDVTLTLGDLKGNPLTGVRIAHPVVRWRDGDFPPLLEAERLSLRYSALGLLTGGQGPIEIELYRPVIHLPRGADGKIRFPKWKPGEKKGGPARRLDVRLSVREGRVVSPALKPGIGGLELRSSARIGAGTTLDIDRLSWTSGPWDNPLESLRAHVEFADSVRIDVRELKSPELALKGTGAWKTGGGERRVKLSLERGRWKWLAKVFDNGAFDVPGQARAEVVATEAGGGWSGSFSTVLDWNELPVSGGGRFTYRGNTLTLTGIDAATPSGRVNGKFEMIGKAWTMDARAEHADPRAWKAFHLDGWPEGDLNGAFQITQSATKDMVLTANLGASTLAGWRADSARVTFRAPSATTDTFTVDYVRRGGAVRLLAGTRSWGWTGRWEARDFPLEEWPDGGRSGLVGVLGEGRGEVTAQDGRLDVTGSLTGPRAAWLGASFNAWKLSDVRGRLLPTPDLTARAGLDDMMFLGLHFDSTRARLRLGDALADLDSVVAFAGDTVITIAGRSTWKEKGWDLALARAEARSRQFHWIAEPPLTLHGDPQGVVFDRLVARDGEARIEARGRWAAPGGQYEFDGYGRDLDLGRLGLPPEWKLAGRGDADLRVRGPNGDPVWSFAGRSARPGYGGHTGDSLSLLLEGGRHRLDVRRFAFGGGAGRVTGTLRFERTEQPWPDTLTGPGVRNWLARAGAWRGDVHFDDAPLEGLDRLVPRPVGWTGRVRGDVSISGRPADPALTIDAGVSPFAWREFRMDRLSLDASFENGRLRVAPFEMARGGVVSTVRGEMPLVLALDRNVEVPEAPMRWDARIPQGDLAILPAFVPQIGWSKGRFDLDANMTGTARHPQLTGTLSVREGSIRLAGREEVLDELVADLRFDETRLTLDTLRARQGRDGRVTGRGGIDLKGLSVSGYRFDLALRDFTATEAGLYAAKINGDFRVTNGPRVRGVALPQVTGHVDVQHAAVLLDFANQSETQLLAAATKPLYWTYRVEVDARRNLRWQPPDGDLEFSADLTLEQTADSLLIYGDLRGERGTYYFLSNRFNVLRADLTFDNESGVNPQLDIEAVTRVVPVTNRLELGSSSSDDRPHLVTARITGRAAEPVVTFSSDPDDWDEPEILQQLTVGRFLDQQGRVEASRIGDPLDHYLTRAINRTVSAELSRAFRGYVNEWALERDQGGLLGGKGDLVMGVGTQITPNLSLRYRQVVPGLGQGSTVASQDAASLFKRQVEAEYRLSRFFYVSTEVAERRFGTRLGSSQAGTDFNVNLKARWEY